ncbi:hypothetical protein EAM01S_10_00130 [Erwinia amylovora NBRC 12687 = CFBP 1232]|nr:hypothetical protein AD997_03130 [Erwinia amylovora]RUT15571.1 hypothetical protein BEI72_11105 [Erwinia amylovora]GAJ89002.1 hypothetical protein EAM01S_10_00130 [Erwinia amylovora NBRC 12687 = CFBP 1232]
MNNKPQLGIHAIAGTTPAKFIGVYLDIIKFGVIDVNAVGQIIVTICQIIGAGTVVFGDIRYLKAL